jgi:hypothetical protein
VSAVSDLLIASLLAGLSLVAVAWLLSSAGWTEMIELDAGPHTLDFSKSFASNLTIFGAVVGQVLTAKLLPSQSSVNVPPKDVVMLAGDYTSLTLLFGLLVVVSPFVYAALRAGLPPPPPDEDDSIPAGGKGAGHAASGRSGRGWAFLIACWLTLWGVIGEIAVLGLLFYEGRHAVPPVAPGIAYGVWAALGITLVLVAYYAVQTIEVIVKRSLPPSSGAPAGGLGYGVAAPVPFRGWTAL